TTLSRINFPVGRIKGNVTVKSPFGQVWLKWDDKGVSVRKDFFACGINDALEKSAVAGNIVPGAFQFVRYKVIIMNRYDQCSLFVDYPIKFTLLYNGVAFIEVTGIIIMKTDNRVVIRIDKAPFPIFLYGRQSFSKSIGRAILRSNA